MQRNFGWGSRSMSMAAKFALSSARKKESIGYTSEHDYRHRFDLFLVFLNEHGIKRMEDITPELVIEYGNRLAIRVDVEGLSPSRAQTLVSAVNSTLNIVTRGKWKSVRPTKDCLIPERCAVRQEPTVAHEQAVVAMQHVRKIGLLRAAAVAELAYNLGLRAKEASLLDAVKALNEAESGKSVSIAYGAKGGKHRAVPIFKVAQITALKQAVKAQGAARSVMPVDKTWVAWLDGGLRKGRNQLHLFGMRGYHELRSSYAANRYETIMGVSAPANGGVIQDKVADSAARLQIADELGHGRIDVVSEYVGGRK